MPVKLLLIHSVKNKPCSRIAVQVYLVNYKLFRLIFCMYSLLHIRCNIRLQCKCLYELQVNMCYAFESCICMLLCIKIAMHAYIISECIADMISLSRLLAIVSLHFNLAFQFICKFILQASKACCISMH